MQRNGCEPGAAQGKVMYARVVKVIEYSAIEVDALQQNQQRHGDEQRHDQVVRRDGAALVGDHRFGIIVVPRSPSAQLVDAAVHRF